MVLIDKVKKNYHPLNCPIKNNCSSPGIVECLKRLKGIRDYRRCDYYKINKDNKNETSKKTS